MDDPTIEERVRQGRELGVWGLKKTLLSKREEVVDLELQVRHAEDALYLLKRQRSYRERPKEQEENAD